jgi:hypothetical protein
MIKTRYRQTVYSDIILGGGYSQKLTDSITRFMRVGVKRNAPDSARELLKIYGGGRTI